MNSQLKQSVQTPGIVVVRKCWEDYNVHGIKTGLVSAVSREESTNVFYSRKIMRLVLTLKTE